MNSNNQSIFKSNDINDKSLQKYVLVFYLYLFIKILQQEFVTKSNIELIHSR